MLKSIIEHIDTAILVLVKSFATFLYVLVCRSTIM